MNPRTARDLHAPPRPPAPPHPGTDPHEHPTEPPDEVPVEPRPPHPGSDPVEVPTEPRPEHPSRPKEFGPANPEAFRRCEFIRTSRGRISDTAAGSRPPALRHDR
jgi:hypothetical protein